MSEKSLEGAEFASHYRHQGEALATRWRLVAVCAVLGGLLGSLVWAMLPVSYTADADVLVRPVSVQPFETTDISTSLSMQTEVEIAESEPVARRVWPEVPTDSLADLQEGLRVTNPPETAILRFSYTAADPADAARTASRLAGAYLADRGERTRGTILRSSESLGREVDKMNLQHASLENRIRVAKPAQAEMLKARSSLLETSISSAQDRLVAMRSIDTKPGDMVRWASPPRFTDGPGLTLWLLIGVVLGSFAGLVAAWLSAFVLGRVGTPGQIERVLEAPLLATVPRRFAIGGTSRESLSQEAYRKVAVRLSFMPSEARPRTLMVVAPRPGTKVSTVAVGLAAALAEAGSKVAVVEADLRSPSLVADLVLDDADRELVTEWNASGSWPPVEQLKVVEPPGVVAVPGVRTPAPMESLTSSLTEKIFTRLGEENDFTIACAPPLLAFSDALAILPLVDAVLLVCELHRTSEEDLRAARELVVSTGGSVVGAVATAR